MTNDNPQAVASNALLDFLIVLFSPSTWIQIEGRFSKAWDDELKRLISSDDTNFEVLSPYRVKIGQNEVWVGNHPYASMRLQQLGGLRPHRATILRAGQWIEQMLVKSNTSIQP